MNEALKRLEECFREFITDKEVKDELVTITLKKGKEEHKYHYKKIVFFLIRSKLG